MSVFLILLLATWLLLVIAMRRVGTSLVAALRPRLVALLGVFLILGSFLFQDWVRFDFIQYLRVGWDPLLDLAPEAAGLFGIDNLTPFLRVLLGAASLNGWQLALAPFFGLGTRAALVFPSLIALAALVWLPFGTSYSGSLPCKVVGTLLAVVSTLALIGLATANPHVDALGVHGQIHWAMLAVLLGVRMEMGPWLTMVGLVLLIVGGTFVTAAANPFPASTSRRWIAPGIRRAFDAQITEKPIVKTTTGSSSANAAPSATSISRASTSSMPGVTLTATAMPAVCQSATAASASSVSA